MIIAGHDKPWAFMDNIMPCMVQMSKELQTICQETSWSRLGAASSHACPRCWMIRAQKRRGQQMC